MAKEVHAFSAAGLTLALVLSVAPADAQFDAQDLPNMGQQITPLAPLESRFEPLNPGLPYDPAFLAGQGWLVGHAVTTVVSPDHTTLLILTSGYNRVSNTAVQFPASWYLPDSTEYVFIYDISTPVPIKKQVLQIPNTYSGIVFDPSGGHFYVAGGPSDNIHTITLSSVGTWVEEQPANPKLALGQRPLGCGPRQASGSPAAPPPRFQRSSE